MTKRNENIDAYNQEIELLEESGASQEEIDKVRRKKDKENDKLEKGQFDWSQFGKAMGDSISGLGASWGTGRWLGGPPGEYDFRREVDEGEEEVEGEVKDIEATDTQAEATTGNGGTSATEAYEKGGTDYDPENPDTNMKDFPLNSPERKAEYDRRGWAYDETIEGY